jgi:Tfp pilus assembly protein PilF
MRSLLFKLAAVLALSSQALAGIWLAQITGKVLDAHGRPLAGATVRLHDLKSGRRFETKTGADGAFLHTAIYPATYELELSQGGKVLFQASQVQIQWSTVPTWIEVDLAKNTVSVRLKRPGNEGFSLADTPESIPQPPQGDLPLVTAINEKLAEARRLGQAGNWEAATDVLRTAAELDPARDLPWAALGNACFQAAEAQPGGDRALLEEARAAYQHALSLRSLAPYHNNLGGVYARLQQWPQALAEFQQAAEADPQGRGLYDFNAGVVLLDEPPGQDSGRIAERLQQAVAAFQRATAADPNNAEAYYLEGVARLRFEGMTQRPEPSPEAVRALRSYLLLQPQGAHAEEVRTILDSVSPP